MQKHEFYNGADLTRVSTTSTFFFSRGYSGDSGTILATNATLVFNSFFIIYLSEHRLQSFSLLVLPFYACYNPFTFFFNQTLSEARVFCERNH